MWSLTSCQGQGHLPAIPPGEVRRDRALLPAQLSQQPEAGELRRFYLRQWVQLTRFNCHGQKFWVQAPWLSGTPNASATPAEQAI